LTRLSGLVLPISILVTVAGCVPALREPPTLEELARGADRHRPEDVNLLLDLAERSYARQTTESVVEARRHWLAAAAADRARVEGLIGVTRADVWLTEHEDDPDKREGLATSAVQAAQLCRAAAPEEPSCKYRLAIAVGVQARERRGTALDALPTMVDLLEEAIAVRPGMDHGGPHRVLALVLLRAPGWPSGPGDPDHGLEEARRAIEIDPDFPPNQLCLGEALEATEDPDGRRRAYEKAAELARRRVEAGEIEAREWLEEAVRALGFRKNE
jgi:hypothetical protein